MAKLRYFIPLLIFILLLGCEEDSTYTKIPPEYEGWLGFKGEFYNAFKTDSGLGAASSILVFTSGVERRNSGASCEGQKSSYWDETTSTLDALLPGVSAGGTASETRQFTLTSQPLVSGHSIVMPGDGLWQWALSGSSAVTSIASLRRDSRFDSLPPWPGKAVEQLLIVGGTRQSAPADPNTPTNWKPIALLREVRFSRNYGVVYLNYWWYDRQGALHEEKLLRTN